MVSNSEFVCPSNERVVVTSGEYVITVDVRSSKFAVYGTDDGVPFQKLFEDRDSISDCEADIAARDKRLSAAVKRKVEPLQAYLREGRGIEMTFTPVKVTSIAEVRSSYTYVWVTRTSNGRRSKESATDLLKDTELNNKRREDIRVKIEEIKTLRSELEYYSGVAIKQHFQGGDIDVSE